MNIKTILVIILFSFPSTIYAGDLQQQIEGFNLQGYTETGEKAWEVHGNTADIMGSDIKLTQVDADVYGQQKMNVTSDVGFVNQATGKMRLEKDVVITSETGAQMTTDTLNWDRNKDLVTTPDKVFINDEKFTATGTGLEAQPGLKNAQLLEDVTVKMNTKPKEEKGDWVTITCDGPMTVDQSKSMAVFEKNVVAVQNDRTLNSDRMEVYFNKETNQLKEAICIGHVVIIQGENKSYSEKAIYKGEEQKMILLGRPKMIMLTQNTMEGKNVLTAAGN